MQLSWETIQQNAVAFSKRWKGIAGRERQQAQTFVREFLAVFGIDDPLQNGEGEFEYVIKGNYIDYLWKKHIAIEMKSKGKDNDLRRAFEQTRQKYMPHLTDEEFPDLWMLCDFENIHITRHSTKETFKFKAADLRKHIKKFVNIAGYETGRGRGEQIEVNVKAADKMSKLYLAFKDLGYDGHELEVYLVRLLFCLFADDTGIFPKDQFYNYIEQSNASDLSNRIANLFEVLNMPDEIRAKKPMISDELRRFQYINGNLFAMRLPPADFNAKMRQTVLECIDFDWNKISPAIFGAMFQGVMDDAKRREMGVHYTSEENIEKLINPLFLGARIMSARQKDDMAEVDSNLVKIIANATLYHFGILTSNVHMAWTRVVCGRLKSDYRYSSTLVYNNFPWPTATDEQKIQIGKLAQAILDARANYPDSSLADLYDPLTMPHDLLKAHRALDSAVMKLYGFPVKKDFTEADCVAALMQLYQQI